MASAARFRVVPAGRRSGKTESAKRKLVIESLGAKGWADPRFFAAAPTRDQAKAIYWSDLKAMIPPALKVETRESDLVIRMVNGAEIWVIGMDKPERIEGRPWNGGILDEFANMKAGAWGENVRPALSDRKGWCWLIGVPEGRNHYYDLWHYARGATDPEWDGFTWKSADILDPGEVEAARRQLDPLVVGDEHYGVARAVQGTLQRYKELRDIIAILGIVIPFSPPDEATWTLNAFVVVTLGGFQPAVDDAIDEVARVLRPGGRFAFFLNHPLLQTPGSGWIDDQVLDPPEQYWRIGPYLVEDESIEEVEKDVFIPFIHRPMSRYVNAMADAGLTLRRMLEPAPPPGFLARAREYEAAASIPRLLVLVAERDPR